MAAIIVNLKLVQAWNGLKCIGRFARVRVALSGIVQFWLNWEIRVAV